MFASITHRPTRHGLIKWRSGFPKSSVMSLLAASSPQLNISIGNSSATSVATTKRPNPLSGLTQKLKRAFAPPRNQCNAALVAAVPALLPVVGLKELHIGAAKLGLLYTSMGIGSVVAAAFILPWGRAHYSPNTSIQGRARALYHRMPSWIKVEDAKSML